MKSQSLILMLSFLFTIQTNAQTVKRTLTRQEAYSYSNLVGNFLDYNDTGTITKTELVMMFLEMDTIGRVTKIHLMAENQTEKSLYGVLKRITPAYFNDKRVIYAVREKTIIFPVYTLKYWEDKDNYLKIFRSPGHNPFNTNDISGIVSEGGDYIHVNGLPHVVGMPKPEPRKPCESSEPTNAKKKKISDIEAIYAEVINQHYDYQPASIIMSDSTTNQAIISTNYDEIAEDFLRKPRERRYWLTELDSTWVPTLVKANEKKASLSNNKLPNFKPKCVYIRFISNDSIKRTYKNMGHYGFENVFKVRDRVSVSNIIQIGNKAIVEINRMCGSLCGDGTLYFLEKRNGKWVMVTRMQTSVS